MKRLIVCLCVIGIFGVTQKSYSTPSFKKWESQINQSITFYLDYSLKSIPQLGLIYCHPGRYGESLQILDQTQSTITQICKKGGGPDQFASVSSVFSDGTSLYLQDISKNKVLKYSLADYSLKDILSTRNFNFSPAKLLGKHNTTFLGAYFKNEIIDFPVNVKEYDAVGVFSEDFQHL